MTALRRIDRLFTPPPVGPGFAGPRHTARLMIPPGDFAATNPFFLMADDRTEVGGQFGEAHPHAGLETVTFMLSGSFEDLEGRALLANIIWANQGDTAQNPYDADTFDHYYGANAPLARSIVLQAIADWDRVIVNFNYANVGQSGYAPQANTYYLYVFAGPLGGSMGYLQTSSVWVDRTGRDGAGPAVPQFGIFGKPYRSFITLDTNGGGHGWYFDPSPAEPYGCALGSVSCTNESWPIFIPK